MTTDESAAARPLVYAHRGASEAFAEHTRAAYLQAIADGADGVECDIHLTRDQHAVLLHDANLDRTSDGTGPVADRTLHELRQLDFSSWKGARIPDEYGARSAQFLTLPDLLVLLRNAGREIGLAIELKHPSPFQLKLEDRVLEVLRSAGLGSGDVPAGQHHGVLHELQPGLGEAPAEVSAGLPPCASSWTTSTSRKSGRNSAWGRSPAGRWRT